MDSFKSTKSRNDFITDYNNVKKIKFLKKETEYLFQCESTLGTSKFNEGNSNPFYGGFRINVNGNLDLNIDNLKTLALQFWNDKELLRILFSLNYHTIEVYNNKLEKGFRQAIGKIL